VQPGACGPGKEKKIMNKQSPSPNRWISIIKKLFFLLILSLLIIYVVKNREEFRFIFSLQAVYLLPVLVLLSGGLVLTGYHFYLVLTFISRPISFFTAFKYFILGGFINKFVPHGGGLFRLVMLKKDVDISYRDSISTLITYGWLNVIISLSSGTLIIGLYDPLSRFRGVPVLGIFAVALLVQFLLIPLLRLVVKKFPPVPRETSRAVRDKLPDIRSLGQMGGDILQRITAVMKNGPILLKSTAIILFNVGVTIGVIYLLFRSIGKPIGLTSAAILGVIMRLSSIVELTPGNLGIREFLLGFLAEGLGQGMAQGMTISMIWRLIGIFNKGVLSLIVLLGDQARRSRPAQESPLEKKPGIFLLGPSAPFRGGISHYNTLLYNHLCKNHGVMFYTFKKQYFQWLFPGHGDKDNSTEKIEAQGGLTNENNGSCVKKELHPLDLVSWIRAGKEARKYPLILLPWWVVFWVPYYLLFLAFAKNGGNGSKVIFLCHNVEEHERGEGGLARWLKQFLTRCVLQKGDGFILHSRSQERRLARLLKKKTAPSVVSPHPHYQVFNKNRYTSSSAREVLGIPPGQKVMLFFGFIRKYKGLESLLQAMPIVKAYDRDILLLIVGEVWSGERYYHRYVRLIKELGLEENTRFINRYVPNEEVELYFKASDFVVLPYTDGSASGILQIAYGMDRPVVATGISVFTDVVEDGKTGLLVPPGDENRLAEAIIKMYTGGCIPRMGEEVHRYKNKFEWSVMVERITQFLNSPAGDNNGDKTANN